MNTAVFEEPTGTVNSSKDIARKVTSRDLITSYLSSLSLRAAKGAISNQTKFTYTQGIKTYARTVGADAPVCTETYITFLKKLTSVSPSSVRTYKSVS